MKNLVFIALASTAFLLQGCKDIIAENIEGQTPVIIIPSNGQTVNQNPVHFKWEAMSGATKYRLQIASPDFSNIQSYALDSVITGTNFYMALDSADYELKLTAMNAGYTSNTLDSVYFTVGVEASAGNAVVLQTPADSSYFSSADAFESTFEWSNATNAAYYEFYLKKGSSFASGQVINYIEHLNPPSTNQEAIAFNEGQYHWGVRAYFNDGTETPIAKAKFFIDTTRPNVPALVSPSSAVEPGNIVFTWNNGNDPGVSNAKSPVISTIEVSENDNFTNIIETVSVQGNTTSINLSGFGPRYWRVRNKDKAGNQSGYSPTGFFTLTL